MAKKIETNDGKKGGWLVGKRHYDEQGNPLGGIKAVVTDAGNKPVELEGGEVIINREASKKYWKELSRINQSAGNGVAIGPPEGADEDPDEYSDGGNIIEFNPNHIPNKWIVSYAKKIKKSYPDIWKLGGNIFGNEAFNNLERVSERGYWLDSEKWMYIKWRSYVARHIHDFRIEGVVAMLKWCDKVEKGWPYMKQLIEEKIAKKGWKHKQASKMDDGGNVNNNTIKVSKYILERHPKKGDIFEGGKADGYKIVGIKKLKKHYGIIYEILLLDTKANDNGGFNRRIVGYTPQTKKISDFNQSFLTSTKGKYYTVWSDSDIDGPISTKMKEGGNVVTYKDKYNTKYKYKKGESHSLEEISKDTGVSMKGLQQIYDKGIGAYKTNPKSVRPNVTSKEQWAMARVYSAVMGGDAAIVDKNELKMNKGGKVGQEITCIKCDWNWNTNKSEEFDKYVCHNCGTDNSRIYAPKKLKGGGNVEWQKARIGDSARVVSENKMGVIVKDYGRKFHLKFVDGTEKTYDADELDFYRLDEDEYAGGGLITTYGGEAKIGDKGQLQTRKGRIDIQITNITDKWVIFNDLTEGGKRKDSPRDKFIENYRGNAPLGSAVTPATSVQPPADIYELKKSIFAPDLYNTKIIVDTPEQSAAFQKIAIELGITWGRGIKTIQNTNGKYLYVDDEFGAGEQILGFDKDTPPAKDFYENRPSKELFFDDLFQLKGTTGKQTFKLKREITASELFDTKINLLSEDESKAFQELILTLGFNWNGKNIVQYIDKPFLFLDDDFSIFHSTDKGHFSQRKNKEIFFKDIFEVIETPTTPNKPVHELANYRIKTEQEFIDEYGFNWKEKVSWSSKDYMNYLFGEKLTDIVTPDLYDTVLDGVKGYMSFKTNYSRETQDDTEWVINSKMYKFDPILLKQNVETNLGKVPTHKEISEVKTERELIHDEYNDIVFLIENTPGTDSENMLSLKTQAKELKDKLDALDLELKKKNEGEFNLLDELFSASSVKPQARYDLKPYNDGFAPDGQPTALPKNIYDWTMTEEFQNWFGNFTLAYNYRNSSYENVPCSVVVSKNYEPLVVYHGTGAEFSFFKFDRFPAMYFAENEAYSNWFAEMKGQEQGTQGYVYPFFLNIRTPLDLTYFEINDVSPDDFIDWMYLQTGLDADELKINKALTDPNRKFKAWMYLRNSPEMLQVLKDKNVCDGIVYYEDNPSVDTNSDAYKTKAYIVFNSNSAKIAEPSRHKLAISAMRSFYLKRGGKL